MQTQVKTTPAVSKYFNDLIDILYENDYFGFEEDAIRYVTDLFEDIKKNLPTKTRKSAPDFFMKFGKDLYYAKFKTNKHTMWYVFFTIHNDNVSNMQTYFIRVCEQQPHDISIFKSLLLKISLFLRHDF